jgi:inner membrane protein involved in colicin E2 resistance
VNGKLEVSQYIQQISEDYKNYGKEGIFYALLIILALTLIFAWNWILCLIGCVIGVIISIYLHFIPGTISTGAYLIVIVVYLIISGGDR